MATVTHALTATWSTTAGTASTPTNGPFTPAVGDLLVVIAPSTGVVTSTVTDNNADGHGTYTQVDSDRTGFSTTGHLTVWVRNALIGSGTSTTVTAPQNGSTGGGLDVFRVSGMTLTGSSAVRSSGGQSTGTAGTTPAPVLSKTPSTFNPIITAVCNGTSPGGVTGPASYTAPTNLGYATPTTGLDTAFINAGITSATITWGSTSATAFGSVAIELDTGGATGPPLASSLSQPSGLVVSLVRTGVAMASLIPPVQAPPPPVTPGPVFFPKPAIRARIVPNSPRAGVVTAEGQPGTGNVSGPLNGAGFGSAIGCNGAPVRNPSPPSGPVFRQKTFPVQAVDPLPRRGRVSGNKGGPVVNPNVVVVSGAISGPVRAALPVQLRGRIQVVPPVVSTTTPVRVGPVFFPRNWPVQAVDPLPRRGRVLGVSQGAPVRNPTAGPVFVPFRWPVQSTDPLPRRGRVSSNPGGPVQNPVPGITGPVFFPFRQAVHIRFTLPLRGRNAGNPGGPVKNPVQGPVFRQVPRPVQARFPLPPRGRTVSGLGGPVQNPVPPVIGPVFFAKNVPVRIRPSLPPRGTVSGGRGGPLRNPVQGPVFPQFTSPVQARIPQTWSKGRTYFNPGGPVSNPPGQGPRFVSLPHPVQGRFPLSPRGRVYSNPGSPVFVPSSGPRFFQRHDPVRIRVTLPPRGRVASNRGGPVVNPTVGPRFRQAVRPIRVVIPQNAPRGRVGFNPGGPIQNIPQSTVLLSLGQPFVLWETGLLFTNWAPGELFTTEDLGLPFIA